MPTPESTARAKRRAHLAKMYRKLDEEQWGWASQAEDQVWDAFEAAGYLVPDEIPDEWLELSDEDDKPDEPEVATKPEPEPKQKPEPEGSDDNAPAYLETSSDSDSNDHSYYVDNEKVPCNHCGGMYGVLDNNPVGYYNMCNSCYEDGAHVQHGVFVATGLDPDADVDVSMLFIEPESDAKTELLPSQAVQSVFDLCPDIQEQIGNELAKHPVYAARIIQRIWRGSRVRRQQHDQLQELRYFFEDFCRWHEDPGTAQDRAQYNAAQRILTNDNCRLVSAIRLEGCFYHCPHAPLTTGWYQDKDQHDTQYMYDGDKCVWCAREPETQGSDDNAPVSIATQTDPEDPDDLTAYKFTQDMMDRVEAAEDRAAAAEACAKAATAKVAELNAEMANKDYQLQVCGCWEETAENEHAGVYPCAAHIVESYMNIEYNGVDTPDWEELDQITLDVEREVEEHADPDDPLLADFYSLKEKVAKYFGIDNLDDLAP